MTRIVAFTILFQTTLFGLRPMVSYRALDLGADPFELGVVTGGFSLLSLLVAIPTGRWVDRHGEAGAIVFGAGLMAVVSAGLAVAGSIPALFVCQAFLGSGHVVNVVGIQALLARRAANQEQRDRRFAKFTIAASFGQLVGPAAAGLLASQVGGAEAAARGAVAVFVAGIALSAFATALALPLLRGSRPAAQDVPRPAMGRGLVRVVRLPSMPHAILVGVTVMTTTEILTMYLPAFGEANGLSVQEVSLLLSTRAAASLVSRLVMTRLVRELGHGRLLVLCTVVPALLLGAWPALGGLGAYFAAMALIGFGLGLCQPLTLTWVAGRVPPESRGMALGLRLTANRFGQMSIPLAAGAVAGAAGISSIFLSMAGLLAVSSLAAGRAEFEEYAPAGIDE
jgi:MFS family permease